MAVRVPYRRLAHEFARAARGQDWRRLGSLIDRNFEEIERLAASAGLDGSVTTTDATVTTVLTIPIPASTTTGIDLSVVARRTGGVAGTAEDGAFYRRAVTYKNVAGTPTLIGTATAVHTAESQAAWDVTFTVSGTNVLVQVTGAANNTIVWKALATMHQAAV